MAVNGPALGAVAAGIVAVYAGIKGYSIPATLQDVITGKSPLKQTPLHPIATPGAAPATTSTSTSVQDLPVSSIDGNYSASQLESLWIMAGGSRASAPNAACHGMQESSGSPIAQSANPDGGTNVGLWQLDTPGGVGAGYSIAQLENPLTNARITVAATRDGADWSNWSTPGC